MTKYQKELKETAKLINEYDFLTYKIVINHRNGWYAVDKYYANGTFYGPMYMGDYKETKAFLRGLQESFFFLKPF